jgi:hypothetical protein
MLAGKCKVYSTAGRGYSAAGVKLGDGLPLAAATHQRGQAPNHNADVLGTGDRHINTAPVLNLHGSHGQSMPVQKIDNLKRALLLGHAMSN